MNYRFAVTRLLNHVPYFRNFDDVTNTVTMQMVFTRCFPLPYAFEKRKFDLFGSEK